MKKRVKGITVLLASFLAMKTVSAAPTPSFYTSSSTITQGNRVTATLQLKNAAAWNVKIVSNGATSGCDQSFADATGDGNNTTKYLSVTCNSTGVGQISFKVTGDATSSDGSTSTINAVKVVTVTAPRQKDTNNSLTSLKVGDYKLSPEFNKDTLEYTIDVPSTVDKVTIDATKASSYASLTGTGEKELNEGANLFEITVTSETGVAKTYKLTINVKDENPINIKIKESNYTIIKNAKNLTKPEAFEPTTIKINNIEIPAFYSEVTNITLVGVKDGKGTTSYAIYNEEKNTYQLYMETKSNEMILFIEDLPENKNGMIRSTIKINNTNYNCLKYQETSEYALIYATNILTGEKGYYLYDSKEGSFIRYTEEQLKPLEKELDKYKNTIVYLTVGLLFTIFLLMISLICRGKKKGQKKTPQVEEKEKTKVETPQEPLEKKQANKGRRKEPEKISLTEELEKQKKAKKEQEKEDELEETMYNILEDGKKRKRKKGE